MFHPTSLQHDQMYKKRFFFVMKIYLHKKWNAISDVENCTIWGPLKKICVLCFNKRPRPICDKSQLFFMKCMTKSWFLGPGFSKCWCKVYFSLQNGRYWQDLSQIIKHNETVTNNWYSWYNISTKYYSIARLTTIMPQLALEDYWWAFDFPWFNGIYGV